MAETITDMSLNQQVSSWRGTLAKHQFGLIFYLKKVGDPSFSYGDTQSAVTHSTGTMAQSYATEYFFSPQWWFNIILKLFPFSRTSFVGIVLVDLVILGVASLLVKYKILVSTLVKTRYQIHISQIVKLYVVWSDARLMQYVFGFVEDHQTACVFVHNVSQVRKEMVH